jgi:hypothetical protein
MVKTMKLTSSHGAVDILKTTESSTVNSLLFLERPDRESEVVVAVCAVKEAFMIHVAV